MSFSFIEIEEQKNHLIFFLFLFLILLYFFIAWLLIIPVKIFFLMEFSSSHYRPASENFTLLPNLKEALFALIVAVVAGVGHWFVSVDKVVDKVLKSIGAKMLDEEDTFHKQFRNVVEEASIAAGGRRVECRVIPTSAVNAFALADFENRSVIGVTEGLLAKLNRAQLETVIGHELAHIVSGDCKMTTIATALFGVYSALMNGIKKVFEAPRNFRVRSGKGGGGIIIFLAMVYLVLAVTKIMSTLLNLFISRQREYRADAVAVRLTRDPVSLAEALHLISRGWRGANLNSEHMANIFIVNPDYNALDESEGLFSDLFSTHPPVKKRIDILLNIAHLDEKAMQEALEQKAQSPQRISSAIVEIQQAENRWFAVGPGGDWRGPFTLVQLKNQPWLKTETWIRKETESRIKYAWQDDELRELLQGNAKGTDTKFCPKCKSVMNDVLYEGTPILRCNGCSGYLLSGQDKVERILVRKQQGFSPELIKMAQLIKQSKQANQFSEKDTGFRSVFELDCPLCKKKMQRRFYSLVYPVEIDACLYCGALWFDKDELEILQILVEQKSSVL